MGHEPNYITDAPSGRARKVSLFQGASASLAMAIRNGQPTSLIGRGFFFARRQRKKPEVR